MPGAVADVEEVNIVFRLVLWVWAVAVEQVQYYAYQLRWPAVTAQISGPTDNHPSDGIPATSPDTTTITSILTRTANGDHSIHTFPLTKVPRADESIYTFPPVKLPGPASGPGTSRDYQFELENVPIISWLVFGLIWLVFLAWLLKRFFRRGAATQDTGFSDQVLVKLTALQEKIEAINSRLPSSNSAEVQSLPTNAGASPKFDIQLEDHEEKCSSNSETCHECPVSSGKFHHVCKHTMDEQAAITSLLVRQELLGLLQELAGQVASNTPSVMSPFVEAIAAATNPVDAGEAAEMVVRSTRMNELMAEVLQSLNSSKLDREVLKLLSTRIIDLGSKDKEPSLADLRRDAHMRSLLDESNWRIFFDSQYSGAGRLKSTEIDEDKAMRVPIYETDPKVIKAINEKREAAEAEILQTSVYRALDENLALADLLDYFVPRTEEESIASAIQEARSAAENRPNPLTNPSGRPSRTLIRWTSFQKLLREAQALRVRLFTAVDTIKDSKTQGGPPSDTGSPNSGFSTGSSQSRSSRRSSVLVDREQPERDAQELAEWDEIRAEIQSLDDRITDPQLTANLKILWYPPNSPSSSRLLDLLDTHYGYLNTLLSQRGFSEGTSVTAARGILRGYRAETEAHLAAIESFEDDVEKMKGSRFARLAYEKLKEQFLACKKKVEDTPDCPNPDHKVVLNNMQKGFVSLETRFQEIRFPVLNGLPSEPNQEQLQQIYYLWAWFFEQNNIRQTTYRSRVYSLQREIEAFENVTVLDAAVHHVSCDKQPANEGPGESNENNSNIASGFLKDPQGAPPISPPETGGSETASPSGGASGGNLNGGQQVERPESTNSFPKEPTPDFENNETGQPSGDTDGENAILIQETSVHQPTLEEEEQAKKEALTEKFEALGTWAEDNLAGFWDSECQNGDHLRLIVPLLGILSRFIDRDDRCEIFTARRDPLDDSAAGHQRTLEEVESSLHDLQRQLQAATEQCDEECAVILSRKIDARRPGGPPPLGSAEFEEYGIWRDFQRLDLDVQGKAILESIDGIRECKDPAQMEEAGKLVVIFRKFRSERPSSHRFDLGGSLEQQRESYDLWNSRIDDFHYRCRECKERCKELHGSEKAEDVAARDQEEEGRRAKEAAARLKQEEDARKAEEESREQDRLRAELKEMDSLFVKPELQRTVASIPDFLPGTDLQRRIDDFRSVFASYSTNPPSTRPFGNRQFDSPPSLKDWQDAVDGWRDILNRYPDAIEALRANVENWLLLRRVAEMHTVYAILQRAVESCRKKIAEVKDCHDPRHQGFIDVLRGNYQWLVDFFEKFPRMVPRDDSKAARRESRDYWANEFEQGRTRRPAKETLEAMRDDLAAKFSRFEREGIPGVAKHLDTCFPTRPKVDDKRTVQSQISGHPTTRPPKPISQADDIRNQLEKLDARVENPATAEAVGSLKDCHNESHQNMIESARQRFEALLTSLPSTRELDNGVTLSDQVESHNERGRLVDEFFVLLKQASEHLQSCSTASGTATAPAPNFEAKPGPSDPDRKTNGPVPATMPEGQIKTVEPKSKNNSKKPEDSQAPIDHPPTQAVLLQRFFEELDRRVEHPSTANRVNLLEDCPFPEHQELIDTMRERFQDWISNLPTTRALEGGESIAQQSATCSKLRKEVNDFFTLLARAAKHFPRGCKIVPTSEKIVQGQTDTSTTSSPAVAGVAQEGLQDEPVFATPGASAQQTPESLDGKDASQIGRTLDGVPKNTLGPSEPTKVLLSTLGPAVPWRLPRKRTKRKLNQEAIAERKKKALAADQEFWDSMGRNVPLPKSPTEDKEKTEEEYKLLHTKDRDGIGMDLVNARRKRDAEAKRKQEGAHLKLAQEALEAAVKARHELGVRMDKCRELVKELSNCPLQNPDHNRIIDLVTMLLESLLQQQEEIAEPVAAEQANSQIINGDLRVELDQVLANATSFIDRRVSEARKICENCRSQVEARQQDDKKAESLEKKRLETEHVKAEHERKEHEETERREAEVKSAQDEAARKKAAQEKDAQEKEARDIAQKKADDDARKKVEDEARNTAQKKADDDARKKAEAEARNSAQIRVEDDARKKAEVEARDAAQKKTEEVEAARREAERVAIQENAEQDRIHRLDVEKKKVEQDEVDRMDIDEYKQVDLNLDDTEEMWEAGWERQENIEPMDVDEPGPRVIASIEGQPSTAPVPVQQQHISPPPTADAPEIKMTEAPADLNYRDSQQSSPSDGDSSTEPSLVDASPWRTMRDWVTDDDEIPDLDILGIGSPPAQISQGEKSSEGEQMEFLLEDQEGRDRENAADRQQLPALQDRPRTPGPSGYTTPPEQLIVPNITTPPLGRDLSAGSSGEGSEISSNVPPTPSPRAVAPSSVTTPLDQNRVAEITNRIENRARAARLNDRSHLDQLDHNEPEVQHVLGNLARGRNNVRSEILRNLAAGRGLFTTLPSNLIDVQGAAVEAIYERAVGMPEGSDPFSGISAEDNFLEAVSEARRLYTERFYELQIQIGGNISRGQDPFNDLDEHDDLVKKAEKAIQRTVAEREVDREAERAKQKAEQAQAEAMSRRVILAPLRPSRFNRSRASTPISAPVSALPIKENSSKPSIWRPVVQTRLSQPGPPQTQPATPARDESSSDYSALPSKGEGSTLPSPRLESFPEAPSLFPQPSSEPSNVRPPFSLMDPLTWASAHDMQQQYPVPPSAAPVQQPANTRSPWAYYEGPLQPPPQLPSSYPELDDESQPQQMTGSQPQQMTEQEFDEFGIALANMPGINNTLDEILISPELIPWTAEESFAAATEDAVRRGLTVDQFLLSYYPRSSWDFDPVPRNFMDEVPALAPVFHRNSIDPNLDPNLEFDESKDLLMEGKMDEI